MQYLIDKLNELRTYGGAIRTHGLDDATILRFAAFYPELTEAIEEAYRLHYQYRQELPEILALDEQEQLGQVHADYVNFYPEDGVNPYISLAARGPWLITLKGAVIYDCGGYGMLGFGHAPKPVLEAMSRSQVMANIMTPNLSHLRFSRALKDEIGHRHGGCPYTKFLCLNSGSEAVSLACRIIDVNVKLMTDAGGRHAGKTIKRLAVKGSFHGRTERPSIYSDSSRKAYVEHLASFSNETSLITVDPYNIDQLRAIFGEADKNNCFIEAMFLEPVMGEGDPGRSVPPEFYKAARELTRAHGSLFMVDSIQAGLRAHGVLSIVDYPGFENLDAPDMEVYSKALNAGQFPLSVLAVTAHTAALYRKGIYGNTMTANPRATDVGCAVLEMITPEVRANVIAKGKEFLEKLSSLKNELGGLITKVQGTGLLFSCELSEQFKCFGGGSTEEYLREHGLGVIHGGVNSLRFTPNFTITSTEVDLVVDSVRKALLEGPRKS